VKRLGPEEAAIQFEERGRHAFLPLTILQRLVESVQPDVVVTTNSPKSEKAAILAAREQGIPSISLIDLFGLEVFQSEVYRIYADRICVFSEMTQKNLVDAGANDKSIKITGNPVFDHLLLYRKPQDLTWRTNHLGGGKGTPCVLWIDQGGMWLPTSKRIHLFSEQETQTNLDTLLHACQQLSAKLLIRPHPNQAKAVFRDWVKHHAEANIQLVDELPLHPLLNAVDAIVTYTSTVGIEAALIGRPVLTLNYEPGLSDLPLADYGLVLSASNPDRILPKLRLLLEDTDTTEALAEACRKLPLDGQATRRVAEQIQEIVSQPNSHNRKKISCR
jgi:UDP-N-acetylglucosamine 2-epimerase